MIVQPSSEYYTAIKKDQDAFLPTDTKNFSLSYKYEEVNKARYGVLCSIYITIYVNVRKRGGYRFMMAW